MNKTLKTTNNNREFFYFTQVAIPPLIVAFFIMFSGKLVPNNLWIFKNSIHNVYRALFIGFIISLISYLLIEKIIKGNKSFSRSALLGLLAAEILIFTNENSRYSISTIILFLFVYFYSVEKIKN